jgi:hypothetical protein
LTAVTPGLNVTLPLLLKKSTFEVAVPEAVA